MRAPESRIPSLSETSGPRAELARRCLAWCDGWWDERRGLPRVPDGAGFRGPGVPEGPLHLVPQAAWYAVGLLWRDGPGDATRAARVLEELVRLQYDAPGLPWHGGFARFAESPPPGPGAVEWQDYDPNWRQFLGTAFLVALQPFGRRLPDPLVERLEASVAQCVRGEPDDRVPPSYSNIALLRAFLEVEAGARLGHWPWIERGEALARAVVERFDRHGAFEEYNSPTYYGIDLFALALWRALSSSPLLRRDGRRLEEALWRDLARWYHAGLRNLCGPFSRTYGMDMNAYVALLGLWIEAEVGAGSAPLPPARADAEHGHDLFLGPLVALLGGRAPDDVRPALRAFPGEHRVEQVLSTSPVRIATGWIAPHAMAGAERFDVDLSGWDQYVAATLHWRHPDGSVAWLALRAPGPSRAEAVAGGLDVDWPAGDGERPARIAIHAAGLSPDAVEGAVWRLPGLALRIDTDASREGIEARGPELRISFARPAPGASARFRLRAIAGADGDDGAA